jgi:hypothetical protein
MSPSLYLQLLVIKEITSRQTVGLPDRYTTMRWSEAGFNHLLHLRLAWVNRAFETLFEPAKADPEAVLKRLPQASGGIPQLKDAPLPTLYPLPNLV